MQQGDQLGLLLFALILHPLLHKIKDSCKLLLHAWYLDDGTIIGDSEEVVRVLNIIKLREGLFIDIRRSSSSVKLLGGTVSRDAYFISGLAMRRAANVVDLMSLLSQLHDTQSLCGSIENIVVYGGPFFGDLQWRLASLPIRFGGLGLYSAKVVSSYAFVASRAQSWVLQDHILRDSSICGMDDDYVSSLACLRDTISSFDFNEVHFDMTMRQKAVFECLGAPHAQDFLLPIPIGGLGQHMSPVKYRTILKYRLMIPLFPVDAICPVCRKACLDSFGEHAVHCKELRDSSTNTICRGFIAGQTTLKVASCKVTKHEKACIENQHVFIPFAFDTFGFFAPEAVDLLSRVQRVMHNNVMTPRSTDVVFKSIGFAIQKGLAAQLVVRLPSTTMRRRTIGRMPGLLEENNTGQSFEDPVLHCSRHATKLAHLFHYCVGSLGDEAGPVTREELGRATWTFIHTLGAQDILLNHMLSTYSVFLLTLLHLHCLYFEAYLSEFSSAGMYCLDSYDVIGRKHTHPHGFFELPHKESQD
ncbi:hypothetical protein Tco_0869687, partial [Tanacetum coccineum]